MENKFKSAGLFIMIGLVFMGAMLPVAVNNFRSYDRYVSVKGLCEREVEADRAIWPMTFKIAGNELSDIYSAIETQSAVIYSFLEKGGITKEELTVSPAKISDKFAQDYGDNQRQYRYVATCVITVYTDKVDSILSLMENQGDLINKGVAITSDWDSQPQFQFEGLNDIKPEMIEEATRNARAVAQKFADDSGSRLGKIKNAAQGTFSIEDRDSGTPSMKKVRVVTSVSYFLK